MAYYYLFFHTLMVETICLLVWFFARSISLLMCQCRDYPEYVHVILGILFKDLGKKKKKRPAENLPELAT